MKPRFISSMGGVDAAQWNALVPNDYPFIKFEFLSALEESGSACAARGWTPCHLLLEEEGQLVAAMPLYAKSHSYGEYVFDWQWASAFEGRGKDYYPKLVTAIPFTPATGPRLLCVEPELPASIVDAFCRTLDALLRERKLSSWHILFADRREQAAMAQRTDMLHREDVQFCWQNIAPDETGPFASFDDFLASLRSGRRKQVRRERRRISEQGIEVQRLSGGQLRSGDWEDFYACYKATYYKRSGHSGYLTEDFFERIAMSMAPQCMMVLAHREGFLVASALFFFDQRTLYGRYWGSLTDHDCLHFEACYYQGIEFAIERGLQQFDPGTQGEHKLWRGFAPVKSHSFHRIPDQVFADAVAEFLKRERTHTDLYQAEAQGHLPFRR